MNTTSEKQQKKHICAALLAHVDAGKTTLSEALLYESGVIRTRGRVDHKDAFLDTSPLERERGITIFSGECSFTVGDKEINLIDTPGHADLIGYAGTCGFLFGDGTDASGDRLRGADHKRNGRRTGAYGDGLETFAEIPDSDVFICQ